MRAASFSTIARALNEANVPFIVVGGIAVIFHGFGRSTRDVDLVIRLDAQSITRAFAALAGIGYLPRVPITAEQFSDPAQRAEWIRDKGMIVLVFHSDAHVETPLDIFITEPFAFDAEYAAAKCIECAPETVVRILQLPTLLTMKKNAGRGKDLIDVSELSLLRPVP